MVKKPLYNANKKLTKVNILSFQILFLLFYKNVQRLEDFTFLIVELHNGILFYWFDSSRQKIISPQLIVNLSFSR